MAQGFALHQVGHVPFPLFGRAGDQQRGPPEVGHLFGEAHRLLRGAADIQASDDPDNLQGCVGWHNKPLYNREMQVTGPLKSLGRRRLNRMARFFLPSPRKGWRCLLYHVVAPGECRDAGQMQTPLALFERQMTYFSENGYRVIRCLELVQKIREGAPPPPKTVAISFDDGDAGLFEHAFPVLQRYGFPATVFLIARAEGRSTLRWDQVREMRQGGLIEFGCHGMTHRRLKGLSGSDLIQETKGAKQDLEDALGFEVPLFAYPFGAYDSWDPSAAWAVAQAGFLGAFTSVYGVNRPRTDPYLLRRTRVSWLDSFPHFRWLLEGAGDWYSWVQRTQGL